MIDVVQAAGMVIVPLMIPAIGFLYLLFAFSSEKYVNKRGQEYFCELHPGEYAPHDASFWYYLQIEHERRKQK